MGLALWPVTLLSADFNLSTITQKGVDMSLSSKRVSLSSQREKTSLTVAAGLSTLTSAFPPDVADVQLGMLHLGGSFRLSSKQTDDN